MFKRIRPETEVPVFWNIPLGRMVFTDIEVDGRASFLGQVSSTLVGLLDYGDEGTRIVRKAGDFLTLNSFQHSEGYA
jgi:hypothetical protein